MSNFKISKKDRHSIYVLAKENYLNHVKSYAIPKLGICSALERAYLSYFNIDIYDNADRDKYEYSITNYEYLSNIFPEYYEFKKVYDYNNNNTIFKNNITKNTIFKNNISKDNIPFGYWFPKEDVDSRIDILNEMIDLTK